MSRAFLPLLVVAGLLSGCRHDAATVAPETPWVSTTSVAAEQSRVDDVPSIGDLEHAFEKASGVIAPSVVAWSQAFEIDVPRS